MSEFNFKLESMRLKLRTRKVAVFEPDIFYAVHYRIISSSRLNNTVKEINDNKNKWYFYLARISYPHVQMHMNTQCLLFSYILFE